MLNKNTLIIGLMLICVSLLTYTIGFSLGRTSAVEDSLAMLRDSGYDDQLSANFDIAETKAEHESLNNTGSSSQEKQGLSPALLSEIHIAVTEVLQEQLQRELKLALDAITPDLMAQATPQAEVDPEQVQYTVDQTDALFNAAMDRGVWSKEDELALAQAVQSVPDEAVIEVSRRVSEAITDGRLSIDPETLFGPQQ